MKPNTPMLAITTGLISCSPGSICRHHFQLNIAVQRLRCIVGLHIKRSAQPTKLHRAPERTFAFMGIPKSLSKCHLRQTPGSCSSRHAYGVAGSNSSDLTTPASQEQVCRRVFLLPRQDAASCCDTTCARISCRMMHGICVASMRT